MVTISIFGASLAGLIALIAFKTFELRRGVKPLSAIRYKADTSLRKKAEILIMYVRYINWRTMRLLVVFLFIELRKLLRELFTKFNETKLGAMIQGKITLKTDSAAPSSAFLQGMSDALKK
jgi:hypothetical protein